MKRASLDITVNYNLDFLSVATSDKDFAAKSFPIQQLALSNCSTTHRLNEM